MPATYPRRAIGLDQQLAPARAAVGLAEEIAGIFNVETIERFLHSSYDLFAGRAMADRLVR